MLTEIGKKQALYSELLKKQQNCTDHFFQQFDTENFEKIIHIITQSNGFLIFTGVGKSGIIAKKIASTIASTGIKSFHLCAMDALHGDLGMISPGDVVMVLSKSGESDELVYLIPAMRNKGASIVGVLCNPISRVASACDHLLVLPFLQELCPFDMTPTISTTCQMLFGDLLTVALMHHKNFQLDDYALNHPSGRIGKRMILKVKDLMLTGNRLPLCAPEDILIDILPELSKKRCGCILVRDRDNKMLGIFTDGDLRRVIQNKGAQAIELPMSHVMNPDFRHITSDFLAWDAMKQMEIDPLKRITSLPVLDSDRKVMGLIHLHDILQNGL